jgi:hypothetical protein
VLRGEPDQVDLFARNETFGIGPAWARLSFVVTEDVVRSWRAGLEDLFACFAGRFSRVEPRRYAQAYVRGLLAPLERKNGWTLAEASGFRSPNGLQDFLQSPAWDPNLVRDDLREYVVSTWVSLTGC